MITDPDEPGYRYPRPGERLWHAPSDRWVTVTEDADPGLVDEVAVTWGDGRRGTLKLRSLFEAEPCESCGRPVSPQDPDEIGHMPPLMMWEHLPDHLIGHTPDRCRFVRQ